MANSIFPNAGGGGSLPLQVAANGDPVVNNADGNVVFGTGTGVEGLYTGNPVMQGYDYTDLAGRFAFANAEPVITDVNGFGFHFISGTVPAFGAIMPGNDSGLTYWKTPDAAQFRSNGIHANLTTTTGVPNGELLYTATGFTPTGNGATVQYLDPGLSSQSLSAAMVGAALQVSLATDAAGVLTTTAHDLAVYLDDTPPTGYLTYFGAAPGVIGDGSGVLPIYGPDALHTGMSALNVTGPTSMDNGAITTDGAGVLICGAMPTSDPLIAGALWNNSGTVKVSAG